jgi:hypothetical protein
MGALAERAFDSEFGRFCQLGPGPEAGVADVKGLPPRRRVKTKMTLRLNKQTQRHLVATEWGLDRYGA